MNNEKILEHMKSKELPSSLEECIKGKAQFIEADGLAVLATSAAVLFATGKSHFMDVQQ